MCDVYSEHTHIHTYTGLNITMDDCIYLSCHVNPCFKMYDINMRCVFKVTGGETIGGEEEEDSIIYGPT